MSAFSAYVKEALKDQELPLFKGPLMVILHFQMPLPALYKYGKRKKFHRFPHVNRPDGDNMEKFINDALNGILWDDDSRIVWMLRSKTTTACTVGCVDIYIKELEAGVPDYASILAFIQDNLTIEDHDAA